MSEMRRKKRRGQLWRLSETTQVESICCWFWQRTCNQTACLFLNKWISSSFFFSQLLWIHKKGGCIPKAFKFGGTPNVPRAHIHSFKPLNRVSADIITLSRVLIFPVNLLVRPLLRRYTLHKQCAGIVSYCWKTKKIKKQFQSGPYYTPPTHAKTLIMII